MSAVQARAYGAGPSPIDGALNYRYQQFDDLDHRLARAIQAANPLDDAARTDATVLELGHKYLVWRTRGDLTGSESDEAAGAVEEESKRWADGVHLKPGLPTRMVLSLLQKATLLTRVRSKLAPQHAEMRQDTGDHADAAFDAARVFWELADMGTKLLDGLGLSTNLLDAAVNTATADMAARPGFHLLAARRVLLVLGCLAAMVRKTLRLVERHQTAAQEVCLSTRAHTDCRASWWC